MVEEWKDIKGYGGHYQISNLGNVKSLERIVQLSNGCLRKIKSKILKTGAQSNGYLTVTLWKDNVGKTYTIHKLVANEWIKNPHNRIEINHIDGDKLNNKHTNLEWSTRSENLSHAYNFKLKNPQYKGVTQYDLNNNIVEEFDSMTEAANKTGIPKGDISKVCNKYRNAKIAGGFMWKFK